MQMPAITKIASTRVACLCPSTHATPGSARRSPRISSTATAVAGRLAPRQARRFDSIVGAPRATLECPTSPSGSIGAHVLFAPMAADSGHLATRCRNHQSGIRDSARRGPLGIAVGVTPRSELAREENSTALAGWRCTNSSAQMADARQSMHQQFCMREIHARRTWHDPARAQADPRPRRLIRENPDIAETGYR